MQDSLNTIINHVGQNSISSGFDLKILFGCISVISLILAIISQYQRIKMVKLNKAIFDAAKVELQIDKKELELKEANTTLTMHKNFIKDLKRKIAEYQNSINNIPNEARRAVLKDRLEESIIHLISYYNDIKSTQQKLLSLGATPNLPADVLKAIEQEIQPRYLIAEKLSTTKTYLSIMSTISGISLAVLPRFLGSMGYYIGIGLLLITLPLACKLFYLLLIKRIEDKTKLKLLSLIISNIILIIIVFFILTLTITFGITEKSFRTDSNVILPILIFSSVLFIGFTYTLYVLMIKYRRYIKSKKVIR